jgi:hypothetical protein
MKRSASLGALFSVLLGLGPAATAQAVTEDAFKLRTGADLVALCTTPPDDPLHASAVHMCHGFAVGTYQTIQAMTTHRKLTPLFCPPEPQPTRNEAIQRFVDWSRQHEEYSNNPPAELIGRYLISHFPCAKNEEESK